MTTTRQLSNAEEKRIQSLMQNAYIPGISFASISGEEIQTSSLGRSDTQSESKVTPNTQFWACSLSKPVFAYLVLKLTKDGTLPEDFLDEELPWNEKMLGVQGDKKPLTARMILSHQTGLQNEGPPDFKFNPGEGFRYSGDGYVYLQNIIEDQTKKTLEELAQANLFGPLGMTSTSFLFPGTAVPTAKTHDEAMMPNPLPKLHGNNNNAAGSLHTTAADYASFLMACIHDKDFIELITPQIKSMEKDIDAREKKLTTETLTPIDWGLGFGLQKDENGKVISFFHWGHGPGARTFFDVKINPDDPQAAVAVVYLTNSENGLAIAKDIVEPFIGDITPIMKFLSEKYGYKDIHSPNWKEYHEYLIAGVKAEKEGKFDLAIESYKNAARMRPENAALQYRILWAETKIHQNAQDNVNMEMLKKLVGEYGPLKISIVESESKLLIDVGEPTGPRELKRINDNTFIDGSVILKFDRDERNYPTSLNCHFSNGAHPSFPALKNADSLSSTARTTRVLEIDPQLSKSRQLDFNSMSFEDFDQNEAIGVRKLAKEGKFKEAGEAIENYISANNEKLTQAQQCLLWFHAGQSAALAGHKDEAIIFFERSKEKVPHEEKLALTEYMGPATEYYLQATIGFLKDNRMEVKDAYEKIINTDILDYPFANVVFIPGRIHDMYSNPEKSYKEIFNLPASLPPLPGEKEWHQKPEDKPEYKFDQDYRNTLQVVSKGQGNMQHVPNKQYDLKEANEIAEKKYSNTAPTPFSHRFTK